MDNNLFEELERLKEKDISVRDNLKKVGRLYGQYAEELQNIHKENAHRLNKIISKHGWPTISKVGINGTRLAWLIEQHSICTPDLQRKFFELLSDAAEKDEAPKKQVALLEDRIRYNEGKAQKYGTILDWNEQGEMSCELESPDTVNQLREEVGMPPFEQEIQAHREEVISEGGKPPKDYEAYQKGVNEWAISIGWR